MLRAVLDQMFAFVCVLDVNGVVIEVNRAPLDAAGLKREDVLGRHFADTPWFSHSADARAHVEKTLERAVTNGETVRADFDVSLGEQRTMIADASFSALRDARGAVIGVVGSAVDVTERRQMELAMRDSDQRFRHLTETMREVFFLVDAETKATLYVSPAYEQVWGRPCRSAYEDPRDWENAIHPDDRERVQREVLDRSLSGPFESEYRIVRPDGGVRWIRSHGSPVRDAAGRTIRIAGFSEDVTERLELEAQLLQAQKMDGLGRLAGGVAHDFNNMLMVIAGNADVLLTSECSMEEVRELVDDIRLASERAASLTRQLLLFSRQEIHEPRVVAIDQVTADGEKMLRRLLGEDVLLASELHAGDARVRIDPGYLTQILVNLGVNARDAMPSGGQLTIETRVERIDAERAARTPGLRAASYVVLSVTDTGCGMSPAVRSRAFEPFFSTKGIGKGTGLGLSVVHGIVERSGGHVDLRSEPGAGSTFSIYLPEVDDEESSARGEAGAAPHGGTESVLLVEDDVQVRALTVRMLRAQGYRVVEAADGLEALEVFERERRDIALLITDVVMPRMGGRQLADALRERAPALKVLYTSGYTDDAILRNGVRQDEVAFIAKPHTRAALLAKVHELLH